VYRLRFFGKIGWRGERNELALSLVRADTALTARGCRITACSHGTTAATTPSPTRPRTDGISGVAAYGDGATGGEADGEPYDTHVDLDGTVSTLSVFATLPISGRTYLTLSGRFDRTTVENVDRIRRGGGPGSLDGRHTFQRFNPAVGVTFDLWHATNLYGQYSEGSRAATSIELGCADHQAGRQRMPMLNMRGAETVVGSVPAMTC
jgi:hypothetical protein